MGILGGIFDIFKGILGSIFDDLLETNEKLQTYKMQYQSMTDDELKREYRKLRQGGDRYRLATVVSILKDRGYGE